MFLSDLIALAVKNLVRMKVRVFISIIGAAIGTSAVILLVAFGLGLESNMRNNMGNVGDLTLLRVSPPMEYSNADSMNKVAIPDPATILGNQTISGLWRLPGVIAVTPQEHLAMNCLTNIQGYQAFPPVFGIDPDQLLNLGWKAQSGELTLNRSEVIVGAKAFENLYNPREKAMQMLNFDPVGKIIELELSRFEDISPEGTAMAAKKIRLRISAVLAETGGGIDYMLFLPLSESQRWNEWARGKRINYNQEGYASILVKIKDIESVPFVIESIQKMNFFVDSPKKMIDELNRTFSVLKLMLGGIGAIALLVAAFGIANTMIMSIYERTREIGLLKSLGATNLDVLSLFLIEAGCIGIVGGLSGISAALGLAHLINTSASTLFTEVFGIFAGGPGMFNMGNDLVVVPDWLVLFALVFSLVIGLVSGVYPAAQAATMDPLRALRQE